ncbi:predicted protein [Culex quinquefasciatus]|uniref:Predicted protein n=1 Tax=Culex quinquefasciatus TaxID=7176 RepID=B0W8E6_CULQU|nr:predicted protein [Culex quinquefasciatus]|eukprot:XP_001844980.1 predicted protein [Culex quinquefasciatus]
MLTHITRHDWNETKHSYAAKLVKEDDGNYLCTVCSRRFINLRTGIPHVFRHMNIIEALFECKSCGLRLRNKQSLERHEIIHRIRKKRTDDVAEPEQAAEGTEETGASFCYETVTKEELIIEDDAVEESGEDEGQEEVPRNSLEGSQVKEDETGRGQEEDSRESLKEQSEPKEGERCGENYDYQLHIKTHKNMSNQKALPREIEGVHTDYDSSSKVACEKSDLPLHCKTCNVFFNNKTNLNVHLWKSKLRFLEKGRSKTNRLLPRDDSKIFTDENGFYNCTKCAYKTVKSKLFRGHVRGHKAVEVGLYTCERFETRPALFRHKQEHKSDLKVILQNDDRYRCTRCDKTYARRDNALLHFKSHSKNKNKSDEEQQIKEDNATEEDRDSRENSLNNEELDS